MTACLPLFYALAHNVGTTHGNICTCIIYHILSIPYTGSPVWLLYYACHSSHEVHCKQRQRSTTTLRGRVDALRVAEEAGGIPLLLELLQLGQLVAPVKLLGRGAVEVVVDVAGVGGVGVGGALLDLFLDAVDKADHLVRDAEQTDRVGLVHDDLVAVGVGGGVGGHVGDGAALVVKDDEPEGRVGVSLAHVGEELVDGVLAQEILFAEGEGAADKLRRNVGDIEALGLGKVSQRAKPVHDGNVGLAGGQLVGDARGLVLVEGAVKGAGDEDAEGLGDEEGGEAAVEVGVADEILPLFVDGGHFLLVAEADAISVFDDAAGLLFGADGEFGDDAKTGAGTLETPEEVRVFGLGGGLDATIGSDDFDLEDVVEGGAPDARRGTNATLELLEYMNSRNCQSGTYNGGVAADANARAGSVGHGTLAVGMELLVELAEEVAGAKGGLPGGGVHGKVLEVLEVNHEAALAGKTKVAVECQCSCRGSRLPTRVGLLRFVSYA